ncbi:MAG: Gldg family protein [Alphaproteobacteria bacterium]|nr:Gldg family protein [Alphaproteobacteria bacterium]
MDSVRRALAATDPFGRWLIDTLTVARHEARLLFFAPLTLIFQVWFLLALAICIFLVADFYATDLASFNLQWTFLPWIALVMAPALAMRAFAETPGDRGLELTLSLPMPTSVIVTGKWLAGALVLLLTLAMTAPFVVTVGYLGDPDWGIAVSGYLGAALLLMAFYAIAILAAALTRDHVAAYVAGLAALSLLLLLGWDTAARVLGTSPAASFVASLATISPKYWLDRMAQGRVELAGFATMLLLVSAALMGATWLIERRRESRPAGFRAWGAGGLAVLVTVVLLAGAARLPLALDLTAEREFTLHPETRSVAATAPAGIEIDFYYSEDESKIPARIRQHAQRVGNLLGEIAGYGGGNIKVLRHRTSEDSEAEEAAAAAGVRRIPMTSGDSFMLGAVFRHGDRQGVIPYFDEERAELLEYDLALAINTLGRNKTPRVGILSPLLRSSAADQPREGLAMIEDLKQNYDIAVIPHFADELPPGLDALVVIDATILKRSMLYSIDQHLMSGRGLIAMLDPYPRFNSANMVVKPEPGDEINDISDLLQKYGARYRGGEVVGDGSMAALVTGSDGRQLNYPYWLRAKRDALSPRHPVTASLNELLFAEAGAFDIDAANASAVALVTTNPGQSGVLPRDRFKERGPEALAAEFKASAEKAFVIAAALAGPYESAFAGPVSNPPSTEPAAQPPAQTSGEMAPGPKEPQPHLQGTPSAALFVIADADWLFDPMAVQAVTVGDRTMTRPLNDNAAFLINMAEYATGNPRLIGIRSRTALRRPFARVADMLKEAQARYRSQEADYVGRIAGVEAAISKVLESTGAKSAEQLPDTLMKEIGELRTKLLPFRCELRQIRRSMRENVEALGARLTLFNLAIPPLLAGLFFAGLHIMRRRKTRRNSY